MSLLHDPSMRDVVLDFVNESKGLLDQMQDILEDFEEVPDQIQYLENFGQMIDRIMGTAQTLGADEIGTICQLGKLIGYKASQNNNKKLNLIVSGIMLDGVDLLRDIFEGLENENQEAKHDTSAFMSRLKWLSEKFKHIERGSVAIDEAKTEVSPAAGKKMQNTSELDDLIARLK